MFHIIAYARHGHGRSDAPPGPYDGPMLAEDLRQLLGALGIQQVHLLGWSMGGDEITALAGRYPDCVKKLIHLAEAYDWSTPTFFKAFGDILAVNCPGADNLRSLDAFRA
jgi:pimeloyl-ACP methyl ester carboxylesterase